MIEGLQPYPRYLNSGVPFLAETPDHWTLSKLGRFGRIFKGSGGSKEDQTTAGVPCVRYGDLYTRYEFAIHSPAGFVSRERSPAYTAIQRGDVLFAGSGETVEDIGRSAVNLLESPAVCGGDVIVFRPSVPVVPEFLGYALDCPASKYQKSQMGRGFTIVHIYGDELRHMFVAMPPLDEQAAIVRFLDYADRQIRRYVHARQKLARALEELKQAIIHRAVTRGLDPTVHLVPSGVEWLGDVPEHWDVIPSRAVFKHRNQKALEGEEILTASQVHGIVSRSDFMAREGRRVMQVITGRDILKHVEPDDFVMSMRSFEGGLEWARIRGAISSAYVVLVPTNYVHPPYFARLLKTRAYISALRRTSDLVRDGQALRYANFVQVPLPRVPLSEQRAVAAFLDVRVAEISSKISHVEDQIDVVREYRTRLIADVVTGKLDVREAASSLPEETQGAELFDEVEGEPRETDADDTVDLLEEARA